MGNSRREHSHYNNILNCMSSRALRPDSHCQLRLLSDALVSRGAGEENVCSGFSETTTTTKKSRRAARVVVISERKYTREYWKEENYEVYVQFSLLSLQCRQHNITKYNYSRDRADMGWNTTTARNVVFNWSIIERASEWVSQFLEDTLAEYWVLRNSHKIYIKDEQPNLRIDHGHVGST